MSKFDYDPMSKKGADYLPHYIPVDGELCKRIYKDKGIKRLALEGFPVDEEFKEWMIALSENYKSPKRNPFGVLIDENKEDDKKWSGDKMNWLYE